MTAAVWALIAIQTATLLGVLYHLGSRIDSLASRLDGRLDSLGSRLDGRIDSLGGRIDSLASRVDSLVDAQRELTGRVDAHLREQAS